MPTKSSSKGPRKGRRAPGAAKSRYRARSIPPRRAPRGTSDETFLRIDGELTRVSVHGDLSLGDVIEIGGNVYIVNYRCWVEVSGVYIPAYVLRPRQVT